MENLRCFVWNIVKNSEYVVLFVLNKTSHRLRKIFIQIAHGIHYKALQTLSEQITSERYIFKIKLPARNMNSFNL